MTTGGYTLRNAAESIIISIFSNRVSVSHVRKSSTTGERAMAAGLSKMLRRFSTDVTSASSTSGVGGSSLLAGSNGAKGGIKTLASTAE